MSKTTIEIIRNNKSDVITSIIINKEWELKKDGKVYDVHFSNQEIKTYPTFLKEDEIQNIIKTLWRN